MTKKILLGLTIASFAILFCACSSSKSIGKAKEDSKLVGVWKNVSPGHRGEMIKVITKGRFVWTWAFENTVTASAGGMYHFDGETYTETIEYGTQNQRPIVGQKAIVKVWFETDNKFHSSGTLAGGMPLNEVWERIE